MVASNTQFFGSVEASEIRAQKSKQLRLQRLQEVRAQERLISKQNCTQYRENIKNINYDKTVQKIKLKREQKVTEEITIQQQWQASLVQNGLAHRQALAEIHHVEETVTQTRIVTETRRLEAIRRQQEALLKSNGKIEMEQKRIEEMHELRRVKEDFRQSTREDARAAGEARRIQMKLRLARQRRVANTPPITHLTNKVSQSALSIANRRPVPVQAKVIRHGADSAVDVTAVANAAKQEVRRMLELRWAVVMKELLRRHEIIRRQQRANRLRHAETKRGASVDVQQTAQVLTKSQDFEDTVEQPRKPPVPSRVAAPQRHVTRSLSSQPVDNQHKPPLAAVKQHARATSQTTAAVQVGDWTSQQTLKHENSNNFFDMRPYDFGSTIVRHHSVQTSPPAIKPMHPRATDFSPVDTSTASTDSHNHDHAVQNRFKPSDHYHYTLDTPSPAAASSSSVTPTSVTLWQQQADQERLLNQLQATDSSGDRETPTRAAVTMPPNILVDFSPAESRSTTPQAIDASWHGGIRAFTPDNLHLSGRSRRHKTSDVGAADKQLFSANSSSSTEPARHDRALQSLSPPAVSSSGGERNVAEAADQSSDALTESRLDDSFNLSCMHAEQSNEKFVHREPSTNSRSSSSSSASSTTSAVYRFALIQRSESSSSSDSSCRQIERRVLQQHQDVVGSIPSAWPASSPPRDMHLDEHPGNTSLVSDSDARQNSSPDSCNGPLAIELQTKKIKAPAIRIDTARRLSSSGSSNDTVSDDDDDHDNAVGDYFDSLQQHSQLLRRSLDVDDDSDAVDQISDLRDQAAVRSTSIALPQYVATRSAGGGDAVHQDSYFSLLDQPQMGTESPSSSVAWDERENTLATDIHPTRADVMHNVIGGIVPVPTRYHDPIDHIRSGHSTNRRVQSSVDSDSTAKLFSQWEQLYQDSLALIHNTSTRTQESPSRSTARSTADSKAHFTSATTTPSRPIHFSASLDQEPVSTRIEVSEGVAATTTSHNDSGVVDKKRQHAPSDWQVDVALGSRAAQRLKEVSFDLIGSSNDSEGGSSSASSSNDVRVTMDGVNVAVERTSHLQTTTTAHDMKSYSDLMHRALQSNTTNATADQPRASQDLTAFINSLNDISALSYSDASSAAGSQANPYNGAATHAAAGRRSTADLRFSYDEQRAEQIIQQLDSLSRDWLQKRARRVTDMTAFATSSPPTQPETSSDQRFLRKNTNEDAEHGPNRQYDNNTDDSDILQHLKTPSSLNVNVRRGSSTLLKVPHESNTAVASAEKSDAEIYYNNMPLHHVSPSDDVISRHHYAHQHLKQQSSADDADADLNASNVHTSISSLSSAGVASRAMQSNAHASPLRVMNVDSSVAARDVLVNLNAKISQFGSSVLPGDADDPELELDQSLAEILSDIESRQHQVHSSSQPSDDLASDDDSQISAVVAESQRRDRESTQAFDVLKQDIATIRSSLRNAALQFQRPNATLVARQSTLNRALQLGVDFAGKPTYSASNQENESFSSGDLSDLERAADTSLHHRYLYHFDQQQQRQDQHTEARATTYHLSHTGTSNMQHLMSSPLGRSTVHVDILGLSRTDVKPQPARAATQSTAPAAADLTSNTLQHSQSSASTPSAEEHDRLYATRSFGHELSPSQLPIDSIHDLDATADSAGSHAPTDVAQSLTEQSIDSVLDYRFLDRP